MNHYFQGPSHKKHRKIIQPLFNLKFCTEHIDLFQKHADLCMKRLSKYSKNNIFFDINHIIHDCVMDSIGGNLIANYILNQLIFEFFTEIVLGYKMNVQKGESKSYAKTFVEYAIF